MKQCLLTLALYFVVYTRLDPICLLLANGKQETACCLSDDLLNVIIKPAQDPVAEKPV